VLSSKNKITRTNIDPVFFKHAVGFLNRAATLGYIYSSVLLFNLQGQNGVVLLDNCNLLTPPLILGRRSRRRTKGRGSLIAEMPSPLRENQQENDDQNTNVDHLKDYFY
jgi:hypothetical protein